VQALCKTLKTRHIPGPFLQLRILLHYQNESAGSPPLYGLQPGQKAKDPGRFHLGEAAVRRDGDEGNCVKKCPPYNRHLLIYEEIFISSTEIIIKNAG
jgi:hypothetical protein